MINMSLKMAGIAQAVESLQSIPGADGGQVQWKVAPTVEYGGYVELGTSRTPAQPYLRPAARTVQANISQHVARADNLDGAVRAAAHAVEAEAKRQAPVDTGTLRSSIKAEKVE